MAVTDNLKILTENHGDAAIMTALPAFVTTLPATNWQVLPRELVGRTTSTATQTVLLNWTDRARLCNGFALCRHNLSIFATIQLTLYAGQNQTGAVLYDVTLAAVEAIGWGEFVWGEPWGLSIFDGREKQMFTAHWFDTQLAYSARIIITDPIPITTYFEASRLYLGYAITPTYNASYGLNSGYIDDTQQVRMGSGIVRSYKSQDPYMSVNFSLDWLSDSERALFMKWLRNGGKSKDVFVSLFPSAKGAKFIDHSFQGKVMDNVSFNLPNYGVWKSTYKIEET